MAEQLQLFPREAGVNVEDELQKILSLRRLHGVSGQAGEDAHLIRAALIKKVIHD